MAERGAAVTGIGGIFFRSRDPAARAAWYRDLLGVDAGADRAWQQEAGPTVFAPFPADSDDLPVDQPFRLNLRVVGLDDVVERLASAGVPVERRAEWDAAGFGRFARLTDPEGLPLELWEP